MAVAPSIVINLPGWPFENFPSVETIAALRALTSSGFEAGDNYVVDGASAAGDGGGGVFAWNDASVAADDGIYTIRPNDVSPGQAGRWILTGSPTAASDDLRGDLAGNGGAALVGSADGDTVQGHLDELAGSTGAAAVGASGGGTVQSELDRLSASSGEGARPIFVIAHRGFARQNPANTTLAWNNAAQNGADALEGDISVSADGTLYMFHDSTVDALTNGTGTFTELDDSYLATLAFDSTAGTAYADLKIPTFADFLKAARRFNLPVYPEIKNIRSSADIDLIVDEVELASMESKTMLSSFNFSDLDYVRTLTTSIGVMFQTGNLTAAEGDINYLAGYGGRTAILLTASPMFADMARAEFLVNHAKSKGVDIICSTIVSQTSQQILSGVGFSKFFCDNRMAHSL